MLGRALLDGIHDLDRPTHAEHARALDLVERHGTVGVDLVDAVVMAMAEARSALILTWDFRATGPGRRWIWPLLVEEHELPKP